MVENEFARRILHAAEQPRGSVFYKERARGASVGAAERSFEFCRQSNTHARRLREFGRRGERFKGMNPGTVSSYRNNLRLLWLVPLTLRF